MEDALFQIVAIALASMAAQWIGWRLKIPAIVFLLLFGFILGPALHIVRPHELMGNFLRPAVTAAVAIILFEGSLNLKLREVSDVKAAVCHIVFLGAPLSWVLIASAGHYAAGLSWPVSITFGGMLVVTGPTVILPMLRNAKLHPRVSSILKWEGIINDPLGVIFAIISLEYFRFRHNPPTSAFSFYVEHGVILAVMLAASYILGRLVAFALERGFLPEYLKAPFLVTAVLVIYAACDVFLQESGLIAIVVFGMTLANVRVSSLEEIKRFKETITLLLVSGIFILLTANLDPKMLLHIDAHGLLFLVLVLCVVRPLTVFISSLGTSMTRKEAMLIGWIAPRGVVCAAMGGVMQPLLLDMGFKDAGQILPLAFSLVIVTVVLHSFSIKWWARKLGLATDQTGGLIIVGSSDWTLQLAETLQKKEIPVVVTDTNWHLLKAGRLANIPVYYGEMLSEEAEYNMELHRYGALLAASPNDAYNALLCNAYAPLLGSEHVYQLSSGQEQETERKKVAASFLGRIFVEAERDFNAWRRSYNKGWRFHLTTVNPAENGGKFAAQENEIYIGAINKNGILACRTSEYDPPVKEGDNILLYSLKASGSAQILN